MLKFIVYSLYSMCYGRMNPCWHVYMWPVVSVCDSRTFWDITGSIAGDKRGSVVSAEKYVTPSEFIEELICKGIVCLCHLSHSLQSFPQKFFHSKEIVAISCSWCKQAVSGTSHKILLVCVMQNCSISFSVYFSVCQFHNKVTCFMLHQIEEPCSLGAHAGVIVPPSWIIKVRKPQVCAPQTVWGWNFFISTKEKTWAWGLCNVIIIWSWPVWSCLLHSVMLIRFGLNTLRCCKIWYQ